MSTCFIGNWRDGIRVGTGKVINKQYTFLGKFKDNYPLGAGKMIFEGCQQIGEYIMTDVFVRKNGILETEQEATWRCCELIYSSGSRNRHSE